MEKKGGSCSAADYGTYLWGANQHPLNGSGNLIQAVGDPNKFTGGKKKGRSGGKGILTAAAVPAVLITANHFYNPKLRRNKYKKVGGAGLSTQDQLANITNNINQIQTQILPQTPSGTIFSNSSETTTYSGTYKGGKGILETIAVPAVLLTANHLYRPRKRTQKRGKRSRRYSIKRR